jgi:hypothetical protein
MLKADSSKALIRATLYGRVVLVLVLVGGGLISKSSCVPEDLPREIMDEGAIGCVM